MTTLRGGLPGQNFDTRGRVDKKFWKFFKIILDILRKM